MNNENNEKPMSNEEAQKQKLCEEIIAEYRAREAAELTHRSFANNERVVVQDRNQLEELVYATIREKGYECNLNFIDVSNVTDMGGLFRDSQFNGDISEWDVSNVTNMSYMFSHCMFNGDISNWNVSNVKYMNYMFETSPFDGDISKWDVSNVVSMNLMFFMAKFNGDISLWNVSNVENMDSMFCSSLFDGNLSEWNVSNVKSMYGMFANSKFKGDLSNWDVSNVTNMALMFSYSRFNGDLSNWDVSNVEVMVQMFEKSNFNQDISSWNISEDSDIVNMFRGCLLEKNNHIPSFEKFDVSGKKTVAKNRIHLKGLVYLAILKYGPNADLNFIDVSNVTDMSDLFCGELSGFGASSEYINNPFDGNISKWDVSNVTNMTMMFAHSDFTGENGDIGQWDVSNVIKMHWTFYDSLFKGNLNQWKISLQAYKSCKADLREYPKRMQPIIKKYTADDSNIHEIVKEALDVLGNSADLNFIDVSNVTDMNWLFGDTQFDGDISQWNVSNVTNMEGMFCNSQFDGDISKWNVSNVTNMGGLFCNSQFDGDISAWNVSNVIDMREMFMDSHFTGDISQWNISENTYINEMFTGSILEQDGRIPDLKNFDISGKPIVAKNKEHLKSLVTLAISKYGPNVDLNFIDVSNVTDMGHLFYGIQFNGNISNWNVSNVADMSCMFAGKSKEIFSEDYVQNPFNGDISKWDVSNVTNMERMFDHSQFNGDISKWNISDRVYINNMFIGSVLEHEGRIPDLKNFDVSGKPVVAKNKEHLKSLITLAISKHGPDVDLNFIDVSNVTDMGHLFSGIRFNGNISNWDVSNVTDMSYMFAGESRGFLSKDYIPNPFNGDISKWNVSNVTNMKKMFDHSQFNGDISKWDVSNVTNMSDMFYHSNFIGSIKEWHISLEAYRTLEESYKNFDFRKPSIKRYYADDSNIRELLSEAIETLGDYADLNFIDVSNVTDMSNLFKDSQFNGDINKWNVSKVTNMEQMFYNSQFNGDISLWNIAEDANIIDMFTESTLEKEGEIPILKNFDVSGTPIVAKNWYHLKNLVTLAISKHGPDVDLNFIDVSNVKTMNQIFYESRFKGDISQWNITEDTDIDELFKGSALEKEGKIPILKNFDVSGTPIVAKNHRHLRSLITLAISKYGTNVDLNFIDVSNVTDMSFLFMETQFNGNISNWDVSNVTNMESMFSNFTYESEFNEDISKWDVSKVTNMEQMFYSSHFNGDISRWDVSNVVNMKEMFSYSDFNGDISNWNISTDTDTTDMFTNSKYTGKIPIKK